MKLVKTVVAACFIGLFCPFIALADVTEAERSFTDTIEDSDSIEDSVLVSTENTTEYSAAGSVNDLPASAVKASLSASQSEDRIEENIISIYESIQSYVPADIPENAPENDTEGATEKVIEGAAESASESATESASESVTKEDILYQLYLDTLKEFRQMRQAQVDQAELKEEKLLVMNMNFSCISGKSQYKMGAGSTSEDTIPAHEVTLSPYMISTTEIPQSLYKLMNGKKAYYQGDGSGAAVYVSWYDAITFCNKLSLIMGYTPCYTVNGISDPEKWGYTPNSGATISGLIECNINASGFRLPTEAEWENAARGAWLSSGSYFSGSDKKDFVVTSRTDLALADCICNELGIYDMSGNVAEWCNDWYGSYTSGSQENPEGPSYGSSKVVRGGGYKSPEESLSVTAREKCLPSASFDDVGFRIVRRIPSEEEETTVEYHGSTYRTEAEMKEKELKRLQKKGNRRKSIGLEVNAFSNGAKVEFTPDDINNIISSATDFQDMGLLAGLNICLPIANVVYLGLDAQIGLNADEFSRIDEGYENLEFKLNAMARFGFNTPLFAKKLMRFSIFAEAGLMDLVPACGVGVEAELLSIITERNLGIGIVFSACYDVNEKIEGTLRYGIALEFLFPTIPSVK